MRRDEPLFQKYSKTLRTIYEKEAWKRDPHVERSGELRNTKVYTQGTLKEIERCDIIASRQLPIEETPQSHLFPGSVDQYREELSSACRIGSAVVVESCISTARVLLVKGGE
ncbi:unnamed protein product [Cyclocybe aegerita]|uniref:Uncharacterized protein n=1 Tax=Cyclocybe aegerita TaxID=1973307 RepID=A0A8S0W0Q6_CYCAE|nr:unnamed protein product [Cyclocybe aegerita]